MSTQVFGEGTPDLPAAGVGRQGISLGHLKLPQLSEYGNAFQNLPRPLCDYWVNYQMSQPWCLFIPVGSSLRVTSIIWEEEDLGRSLGVSVGTFTSTVGDVYGCRGKSWVESHGPRTKAEIQ